MGAKTTYVLGLGIGIGFPPIPLIISVFRVEVGHGAGNKPLFVTQHQDNLTQKRMWERAGEPNITGQSIPLVPLRNSV